MYEGHSQDRLRTDLGRTKDMARTLQDVRRTWPGHFRTHEDITRTSQDMVRTPQDRTRIPQAVRWTSKATPRTKGDRTRPAKD